MVCNRILISQNNNLRAASLAKAVKCQIDALMVNLPLYWNYRREFPRKAWSRRDQDYKLHIHGENILAAQFSLFQFNCSICKFLGFFVNIFRISQTHSPEQLHNHMSEDRVLICSLYVVNFKNVYSCLPNIVHCTKSARWDNYSPVLL